MGEFLWIMLLLLWPILFVRHVIKWRRGKTNFFDNGNYESHRLRPGFHGIYSMLDEEEEVRQLRRLERENYILDEQRDEENRDRFLS